MPMQLMAAASAMGTACLATPSDRFGDAAPQRKMKAECPLRAEVRFCPRRSTRYYDLGL
jgi:hypothetical protein